MAGSPIKGFKPDGTLPDVPKNQVQGMIEAHEPDLSGYATKAELGSVSVGMPIFASLAEARDWEAANPGKKALYTGTGGTTPDTGTGATTPPASGTLSDYSYQWVSSGYSAGTWTDSKAGVKLTSSNTALATPVKNGLTVDFSTNNGMKATAPLTLGTGAKTITVVAKSAVADTSLRGLVGNAGVPAIAVPGGGGSRAGFYPGGSLANTNIDIGAVDTNMHIITLRADGTSSTLTHDRKTVAAVAPDNLQFSSFMIGGLIHGSAFNGSVSEVRIYNRRISDDELTALHTQLGGTYGVTL